MKRKKLIFPLIILCILRLLGAAFLFLKLKTSPKQKIIKAVTTTCSSLTAVAGTSSDQLIGMDKINTVLEEQSAQISGDFTIEFVNKMLEYDFLNGFTFAFNGKRDLTNQEASFELNLGEKNPLTLSTYLTSESWVLSAPKLSDTNHYIDFTKINEALKDSFLGDYFELPEVTIQPFKTPSDSAFSKVFYSFLKNRGEDFKNLFSDITLKKQGKKKTITTLNGTRKCTTYEVTLPKESIEDFRDSFQDYLDSNTAAKLDLSEEAYEKLQEDMDRYESLLAEHLKDDVIFLVSLDKDGILREFSASYKELSIKASFIGAKTNTDAISGELQIEHESYPVTVAYEETVSKENDMDLFETSSTIFLAKEPEKKIEITTENAFSPETLKFSNTSKLVVPTVGINAEFSYEGVFTDYVKNQSFSADIDELKIKVFGIRIFSLQGELSVSPLKEPVTSMESGTNLFTLTVKQQEELFENLKNTLNLLKD